jgi:hypothetical protein
MRKVAYAMVAIGAALAVTAWSAPSWAEFYNGPVQQNGKCWKNQGPAGMGYWDTCPKPAAATTTRQGSKGHHS